MTHAITTNLCAGNFYTTTLTNNASKANAFIFTAGTFPVFYRTKNLFAEKSVLFRLKRAVVDCFVFLDFTT